MNYEKKYKEALELARDYYKANQKLGESEENEVLSDIFPELKESDDEKIRKEIISALKNANYKGVYDKHLAWLEKQGESYTKKDVDDAYFKGISDAKNEFEKQYEANYQIRKDIGTFIFNHSGIKDRAKWMDYLGVKVSFVENQGEQNLGDKVEPKFKVGDWIVWKDKCYKVNYNGCGYELVDQNGLSTSLEYGTIDENAHLWTIQNAKNGDVLFEDKISSHPSPFIVIFKKKDSVNTFSSHCFIGFDGKFYEGEDEHYSENLHPATKEQRDLLFQKMKEAGYEWNVEKKELKKIHVIDEGKAEMDYCFTKMMNGEKVKPQSPTPMSYGKELEARMYEACNRFNAPNTDPNRYSAADLFYAGVEAGCNLNTPAEWSEEDERMLNHIIGYLHSGDDFQTGIDWMKSLKERYTWKPSDEQMKAMQKALVDLCGKDEHNIITGLYYDLKKLREE